MSRFPLAPGRLPSWLKPAGAASILWWLAMAAMTAVVVHHNGGHFSYALDDAYIHMAVARHWVQQGVFGVSADRFAGAVSSMLWPLLLAGLPAGGRFAGFFLNLLLGMLALLYLGWETRDVFKGLPHFVFLTLAAFFCLLPTLAFVGMEHTLHLLLTLAFLGAAGRALSETPAATFRACLPMMLLAPALTATRYEGLFAVAAVCLFLLVKKGARPAMVIGLCGLVPAAVFGGILTAHGREVLPYTLLAKSSLPSLAASGQEWLEWLSGRTLALRLLRHPYLLCLLAAAVWAFLSAGWRKPRLWTEAHWRPVLLAAVLLLHVQWAEVDFGFYRYDAYVIAAGLWALAPWLARSLKVRGRGRAWLPAAAWLAVAAAVLGYRAGQALVRTPAAVKNIHEQQVQMGRFLRRYYTHAGVAANDIGAINYLADIRCLDLAGIDDPEVFRLRRSRSYDAAAIQALAQQRQIEIALVYDAWFSRAGGLVSPGRPLGLPGAWVRVGQWTIADNVVCGDDTVVFYGVTPEAAARLRSRLAAFAADLPPSVTGTLY